MRSTWSESKHIAFTGPGMPRAFCLNKVPFPSGGNLGIACSYLIEIRGLGFNCSDEYIYERCLEILESDNKNYLKMDKICHEAVDEYIRKMRMTGLLSLRGNGRFLDINSFEKDLAEYVMNNYMTYPKFDIANDYIDYMGIVDNQIIQI